MTNATNSSVNGKPVRKAPINIKPTPEPAADHDTLHAAAEDTVDIRAMLDSMGFVLPSWRRSLLSLAASFCAGYAIGSIAATLLEVLYTAAIMTTGSVFIATAIWVMGFIVAMYAAVKAGQKIGMYFATGDIDRDLSRAWGWAKNLVTPKPVIATAR